MKKYIFLYCLIFSSLYVQAQQKWTLRQCIDYAIVNNIEVMQEAIKVEQAKVDVSTSKNSRLPNLNFRSGGQFSFGRSPIGNGLSEQNNSVATSFGVESYTPIFTGFRIPNQIKADELNLRATMEGLNRVKESVELQVTSLYLETLFKKEILKAYKDQYALTKQQEERTEILVNAGKVPLSQLYDIKAQLAKDEMNVTNAQNDLDLSLLNLSQSLNLASMENFDIVNPEIDDVIGENIHSILPPADIYRIAVNIKPQVKEAEYSLQSNEKMMKVAKAGYYPTLDFGIGYSTQYIHTFGKDRYRYIAQKNENGVEEIVRVGTGYNNPFFTQLKDLASTTLGVTLNIPIFNRFETRNNVRKSRLNIQNSEFILDNIKLNLYKEIQQAYQNAVASQAKYNSTERAYEAAEKSFEYARERYEVGKSTVFELNEAQTKLLTSQSENIQAKYDFLFRAKILDFYQGKEINID